MKIAVVSDCFLPRLGGIEVQVSELAKHLRLDGHDVEVFTITPAGPTGSADAGLAFPVHRFPSPIRLPGNLLYNPAARKTLRAKLSEGDFDVVHAHFGVLSPFAHAAVEVALSLQMPVTVTWHSLIAHIAVPAMRISGWLDQWARANVALTAVSQVAAQGLRRSARGPIDVAVLPNGLDLATWWRGDRAEVEPHPGRGGVRVVCAMRLAPRKRPDSLLSILRAARAGAPEANITLELVGEGQLRSRLERSISEHGDQNWVSLPGRLTRDELRTRYEHADLYVSPVKLEAFGIAALEARCCGLPVVGHADSGISEFVDDSFGGVLVGPRDGDEGIARAIARLATDHQSRTAMRRYNLTHAPTRLDWPNVVAATLRQYERAGADPGAR